MFIDPVLPKSTYFRHCSEIRRGGPSPPPRLTLAFVVRGGLGPIWGSLVAAAALTILPEALRGMDDLRMLIYSIVLILVMLATNAPSMKAFFSRVQAAFGKKSHEGGKGNAV